MRCNVNPKNLTFQKVIWICFLLIFLGSIMFIVFITNGLSEKQLRQELFDNPSGALSAHESNPGFQDRVFVFFRQLQHRIIWTLGFLFLATAALFSLMVRTISSRLEKVIHGVREISLGQLNVTIPVEPCDEIGKIGETINDLVANFQEILLGLWNHTESCLYLMAQTRNNSKMNPKRPDILENALEHMHNDLESIQTAIKSFEFYDICLESGKVVTLERNGKAQHREGNH